MCRLEGGGKIGGPGSFVVEGTDDGGGGGITVFLTSWITFISSAPVMIHV